VAPYLGIGIGNPVAKRVGFMLDVGAMYAGAPGVEVASTNMLTPMQREGAQIEDNVGWAQVYPVLSLGVSVRLF
jgi:hypothetical protein